MVKLTKLMLTLALLVMGVTGAKAEDGTKTPLLLLRNGVINTTEFDITPIAPSTLEADNLYAATFTSKGGYCNTFKYENLDVSDYDKAVVKYTIAEGNGDWEINLPNGSFTALPIGSDQEYEISLDGVDSYGDFTVFSWNHSGKSITISEVYLFKSNEPQPTVDRWLVCDGAAQANSWDKQVGYLFTTPLEQGATYVVTADIKSIAGGDCSLWSTWEASENKNQWGGTNDVQYLATKAVTTSLTTYSWEFTASWTNDKISFVFGTLDGKIYFDNVSCKKKGTDIELIANGDFSSNSTTGWSTAGSTSMALEEVPSDPLAGDKEVLSAKIARAQLYNGLAYTDASFGDLTSAISAAEEALFDAGATAESLAAAKDNIQAKIDALAFKDGYSNLTEDMMYSWTGWGAEAVRGSNSAKYEYTLFESTGQPYGDPSVNAWADLSGYESLIVVATAGTPRIMLNRDANNGQWNADESQSHLIEYPKGGDEGMWSAKYYTKDGNIYTIDLAQMVADKGYARLNAIKGSNGNVTVSGMYLYRTPDPLQPQKDALQEKIDAAKLISDLAKTAESYANLQSAITAAEAAIAASGATAESLAAAEEALEAAINGLQIAEGYRQLVAEDFFRWDAVQNPTSRSTVDCAYGVGTSTGMPYGDASVDKLNYANLRQYDKLIVTVAAGAPRFLFNRDVDGGDWNATEAESHLIDNTKGDANSWHAKYFTKEGNTYIVDLKQLVADKGIANLIAIKGANWADVTITGMYLYKEDALDTYGIIGPLVGGWNDTDEKAMTEGPIGLYTYTFPDEFLATKASYEYKLRANGAWGGYELPASGNNTWTPEEQGGYYNVTVTADVLTNSLTLEAVPVTVAHTATFTTNLDWEEVYAFVWTEGKKSFLGDWPGTKIEATEGVYTVNFESTKGGVNPAMIIFNNGLDGDAKQQTSDLAFEDGKAYTWNLNYYVMSEDFFDSWDASDAGKMTKNADGTYTWSKEGVALSSNQAYKVMKDLGGNTTWYPFGENNKIIEVPMAGTYDIAITFNPADESITEAMSVYKSISDAGYATYCTPYALNFEGTGVKAYIAKIENGSEVKFYEVTNAPANTGLLLKADEGSYKLKMEYISGEGATDATGNALIGVNEQTVVDKKGIFVLLKGDKGVGFYKTTAESFTVGANTAYIDAIAGDNARSFIALDGETTAIEGIATEKVMNGEVYNLQGQRVVKAQKGLYIINGKKVVIK